MLSTGDHIGEGSSSAAGIREKSLLAWRHIFRQSSGLFPISARHPKPQPAHRFEASGFERTEENTTGVIFVIIGQFHISASAIGNAIENAGLIGQHPVE